VEITGRLPHAIIFKKMRRERKEEKGEGREGERERGREGEREREGER
jgi:hypothetical protein